MHENTISFASRRRARSAGFSLIEILVVVGIIIILVGIGVVGIGQYNRAAEAELTRSTMAAAMAAMTEYQAQTGQVPATGSNGDIEALIDAINTVPEARAMLDNLKAEGQYDGADEINDAWGGELRYYKSNLAADPNQNASLNRIAQPFLVSPGPDGDIDTNEDNIYSNDIR